MIGFAFDIFKLRKIVMKKMTSIWTVIFCSAVIFSGCSTNPKSEEFQLATGDNDVAGDIIVTSPAEPYSLDLVASLTQGDYRWEYVENEGNDYYKLTEIVYAANACHYEWSTTGMRGLSHFSTVIQSMNIFVPSVYADGIDSEGALILNSNEKNGYNARTAPVIYENNNAGYMTGVASDIVQVFGDNRVYLERGFIYVNAGSRGRDTASAPWGIVDLKSGLRFLRANSAALPGDMEHIVSVGTSGGGAMSSLVGSTGNMDDYYPYLYEAGAAGMEKQGSSYLSTVNDDVYAAQLYCPIADLENADMSYAWMRYDSAMNGEGDSAYQFTDYQKALEDRLADSYVDYLNSLKLKDSIGNALTLESARSGSYYDAVMNEISRALNSFIAAEGWRTLGVSDGWDSPVSYPYAQMNEKEWLASMYGDSSSWLSKDSSGNYQIMDMASFVEGTGLNRNKDIPGFDDLDQTKEGNAFSSNPAYHAHFSESIYNVMAENDGEFSTLDGYNPSYLRAYKEAEDETVRNQVYLYSAMQILTDKDQISDVAPYWRMRNGTFDEHTSFSINYNIALTLQTLYPDVHVDYALVWNMPHGAKEGSTTGTLVDWVDSICK